MVLFDSLCNKGPNFIHTHRPLRQFIVHRCWLCFWVHFWQARLWAKRIALDQQYRLQWLHLWVDWSGMECLRLWASTYAICRFSSIAGIDFSTMLWYLFWSRASFSQVLTSMAMFFKWRFSISLYWSFCLSSFPLFYTQLYIEDGFRQTFIIHSYDMANLSQLSSFDEGLSTKCPSTFKHFHIQYLIFPLDL